MVEDVKCESVKLKDGSEINTPEGETLAEGTECFTLDADGNKVACGDGPYELEDGRSIVVSGGKVESIKEAEAVEAVAEEMAAPMVAPEAEVEEPGEEEEGGDTLDVRVANLEGQIAQILELLQGMSNAQEMAMSKIKEIADAPATESIKVGKTADVAFNSVRNEMDELKSLRKKYNLEVKH
jgi:hypothetical protein